MCTRLVLILLGLILSSPHPALAVPIDVGGSLEFTVEGGPTVNLVGTSRGFTVSGSSHEVAGILAPFGCRPCLAGEPINVNAIAVSPSVIGSATLDGKTFGLGGVDGAGFLNLFFSGPPLFAPPLNVAPLVALTEPVDFSGSFPHVNDPSHPPPFNQTEVAEQLRAIATATVVIKRLDGPCGPSSVGCWDLVSGTYELTPTPEPMTLLLFGTAMAGLGLARWRRRKPG